MDETLEEQPVNLASGLLGWVLPGLGQIRNGDGRRGRLVMLGVLGLFLIGVLVGGVDCVDRREDGLWFMAQAGAGPVAFLTDAANGMLLKSGKMGQLLPTTLPNGAMSQVSSFRSVGVVNDMGTLFTSMAGLLNVIAALDALRGPRRENP